MKNKFKKLLAFAIFAIMTMAMAVTAMAEETQTPAAATTFDFTINDQKTGSASVNTYKAYQIATFKEATLDGKIVFNDITLTNAEFEGLLPAEGVDDSAVKKAASEIRNKISRLASDATIPTYTSVDGVFTGLPTGYYLMEEIEHNAGDAAVTTRLILQPVYSGNTSVNVKSSMPTIEKKIVLENSSANMAGSTAESLVDSNVVAIGDTVSYRITSTIPEYPSTVNKDKLSYIITDTMSNGLTPTGNITVKIGKDTITPEKINVGNWTAGKETTITIELTKDQIVNNGGATVTVDLSATLNDHAEVGNTGNPNSVKLTYSNNANTGTTTDTKEDTVITFTGKLGIYKIDKASENKESKTALAGAVFGIYGTDENKATNKTDTVVYENTTYYLYKTTAPTGQDGLVYVEGLDRGSYVAVEKTAPVGYDLDSTPQEIQLEVAAKELEKTGTVVTTVGNATTKNEYTAKWSVNKNKDTTMTITNKKGTTLPGTGGMGTTIFTIGGIVLVALAALMFVVYMRKQKKQA